MKRACRAAGVEKLEAGPKGMVFQFRANKFRNPAGLVQWLGATKNAPRLRPDHKLSLVREMTMAERVRAAGDVLENLVRIADVKA